MLFARSAIAAAMTVMGATAAHASAGATTADDENAAARYETAADAKRVTPAMRGFNKSHASFPKQRTGKRAASDDLSVIVRHDNHGGHWKVVVRKTEPAETRERYAQN